MSCDSKPEIFIFSSPEELAEALARDFQQEANSAHESGKTFSIALPGGSSPRKFFQKLASTPLATDIHWTAVHLFWGDERCVPPAHPESNFGMTRQILLESVSIPAENIHRIQGEADPESEAERYAEEIGSICGKEGFPRFDWVLLGLGEDGHTASLFPGGSLKEDPKGICGVGRRPDTGQKRITLTLKTINNAAKVLLLATGKSKAGIAAKILQEPHGSETYSAGQVAPESGRLVWYLDREASALVKMD